jgi:hypothetical protein
MTFIFVCMGIVSQADDPDGCTELTATVAVSADTRKEAKKKLGKVLDSDLAIWRDGDTHYTIDWKMTKCWPVKGEPLVVRFHLKPDDDDIFP